MKKVTGYVSVRALGTYDFEFFVEDDATGEESARGSRECCIDFSMLYRGP